MKTAVEKGDVEFATQLTKFCGKYPDYSGLLNVNGTKITNLNKGSVFINFVLDMHSIIQTAATGFTGYKDLLRHGMNTDVLGALPVLPVYPSVEPPICLANLEALFRDVIQDCVRSGKLTEEMAKALGIFGEPSVVLLAEGTPDLSLKSMSAGHPLLHCKIGDYQGYEVWKDTGSGFVFLNVSNAPDYIDQSALPALGVEAIWKYKTIYRYQNQQIGNWSATISVAVKGNV